MWSCCAGGFKMQNARFDFLIWILLLVPFIFGCPGKSGLKDPLSGVPDESAWPGLAGGWSLKGTVTESDCEEIKKGEIAPDRPLLTIEGNTCSLDEDSEFRTQVTCEVGGEKVGVLGTMDVSGSGCELHAEQKFLLNYNAETGRLSGEGELNATVSGNCPAEVEEKVGGGCRIKMDIEGTRFVGIMDSGPVSSPSTEPTPESEPGALPASPLPEPVSEAKPEPGVVVEPGAGPEPATEPESKPVPKVGAVLNSALVNWMIGMCEGVVCAEGKVCLFGTCLEKD